MAVRTREVVSMESGLEDRNNPNREVPLPDSW